LNLLEKIKSFPLVKRKNFSKQDFSYRQEKNLSNKKKNWKEDTKTAESPERMFRVFLDFALFPRVNFVLLGKDHVEQKKFMIEFLAIFVYFLIALTLALVLVGVSFIFATRKADPEKISAYECGFDPFDDARSRFDIQFYLVAILFIIFDLEVTFLFPWALSLNQVGFFGFWSMMVFLIVLTIGFIYEWRKGALDWS
jgi:NADH:ubiquinone oxidoreductase subunit 3 (subunit A)